MAKTHEQIPDDILEDKVYIINRNILKAFGMWPYQRHSVQLTIISGICLAILSVVVPEVTLFIQMILQKDINRIVDCIPNLILTYVCYVMIFNNLINYPEIKKSLFKIKSDWVNLRDESEIKIFREYAETCRFLCLFFLVATSLTLIFFCLEPLIPFALDFIFPLNESRPVRTILEVEYFLDTRKYYLPIYFHNLQAAYFVIFTILNYDFYYLMVVQHSCSMFATLGCMIEKIKDPKMNNTQDHLISPRIIKCVQYHRDCVEFAELIEDTLSVCWILQIFMNMVLISFVGVQTITRTNEISKLLKYTMTTGTIVIRLFYVSWTGQKMLDHSAEIYNNLCNLPWYEFPEKSKRLLLLMMLRSTRPCQISAGKILYLNLQSYCVLMKTSGSYFTMILSTQ